MLKKYLRDPYNYFLAGLTLLTSLPLLAPILLAMSLNSIAKIIYFIYSFFCHQFAVRSIYFADYQYAWCARDTGIWVGITLTAWYIKFSKSKGIKWYWAIPFIIPMALDGGIQTIMTFLNLNSTFGLINNQIYLSNNFTRFVTGTLFGIGISLWLSPMIKNIKQSSFARDKFSLNFLLKKVFPVFLISITIYIGLIGLWSITSVKTKPTNFIDSVAKVEKDNFFLRRRDAVCPASPSDFFAFSCFFKN